MILLMVAYAPDYGTIAAVAAGPVEDFFHENVDSFGDRILDEAKRNARFRTALRATYLELPAPLEELVERDATETDVPAPNDDVVPTPNELRLMIAWFHHHDTHSATTKVELLLKRDADAAVSFIDILLMLADEKEDVRDDVFLFAVEPLLRSHFHAKRDALLELARKHHSFREWAIAEKRPPIEDAEAWREFVSKISSA